MAKINKVGHVVFGCRDPQASIKFYTEALGMELVQFNQELQMAFFSCGEWDHDIAVIKVPDDQPMGSAGLTHTALQIEGGEAELRALYQRLKAHGVKMDLTADHFLTKSVYVFDPDGNRLESFCASMEMAAAPDPARQCGPLIPVREESPVNPEHLIAPPRTWEELRDEVQARTDRQVYPMTGMRSEDVHSILSQIGSLDRDAWGRAWSVMARSWIARGEPLESSDPEGAGEAYLMAWRYASFGGWPIAISPAKKASYQLSLEAFRRFGKLQAPPIETVKLSVPSYGPDADITVYLQLPAGRRPVPVMISIGDLDSYKEYVAERYGPVYMRSGLGYVAADAPHTGEAFVDADERGERIYTAIIDYLLTRTDVDPARIGVQGVSLGGYWATKVAFAEHARLKLAVNWAGLLDAAWSPDQLRRALGSREYLFDLPQALCTVWGYETPEALVAGQSRMSIERQGLVGRPTPRMLVVNGLHDSLVPAEDSLLLQSGTPKSAWLNPGGIHLGRSSELRSSPRARRPLTDPKRR